MQLANSTYSSAIQPGKQKTHLSLLLEVMLLFALFAGLVTPSVAADGRDNFSRAEDTLMNALSELQKSRLDVALSDVHSLITEKPTFKLAHLIYGDLLMAKAGSIRGFGNLSSAPQDRLKALREEFKKRWQYHIEYTLQDRIPANLIFLSPHQKHIVLVDMKLSRLFIFENRKGVPVMVRDFYATTGKKGAFKQTEGDKRTPIGVYQVTSYIPDASLPDLYGAGAFPLNYPNEWDRRHGKTGHGIWVHGTPADTYSRPPRASDGCVALSNPDFNNIKPYVDTDNTPVIIADKVAWLDRQDWTARRDAYTSLVNNWQQDWQSLDTARYLGNYSKRFHGQGYNYNGFARHKKRVARNKTYIKVDVRNLNIYSYPGEKDMLVMEFDQAYHSNNYSKTSRKRQYWHKESDNTWRIIYEGPA